MSDEGAAIAGATMTLPNAPRVMPPLACFDLATIPVGDATYLHFDVDALLATRPELRAGVERLFAMLPRRTYRTIDYQYRRFKAGESTAPHTRWHCDGDGNDHLIYTLGACGTLFLTEPLTIPYTKDPTERDRLIHQACQGRVLEQIEAPAGCPVLYSSGEVHAARTFTADHFRFFVRLCVSDYLTPRNYVFPFASSYPD